MTGDGFSGLTGVRPFAASEWQVYRDLRLRALADSPDAFGSTYAESSTYPDARWEARLSSIDPDFDLPMAAWCDGSLAGLAWVSIDEPGDDVAHLYQMWIAPEFRRKGLARSLMEAAITWATGRGRRQLVLEVTCGDRPARRLYEALGFAVVGEPRLQRPGEDILEDTMVLDL